MNYEKANQWFRKNYPQLENYEIRAATDVLWYSFNNPSDVSPDSGKWPRSSCRGFMNVVARTKLSDDTWGGEVVLLMPEDL